jgi:DHA3 family macrolide efflux protein-like MFS transporter
MFQAIQLPATIALVPQMVPKSQISRINGLNSIFNNIVYIFTPIAGALFLELNSIEQILWIDLLTFLIALLSLNFVSVPDLIKTNLELVQNSPKASFKGQFIEGLAYLRTNGFMVLIIGGMFANILINPLFTLLPYFIKHVHQGGVLELALIIGLFQMGSLIGALFITLKNFIPQFQNIVFAVFLAFSGLFLLGISPIGYFPVIALGTLVAGISLGTVDIMIVSILQTYIPSELQGRVFSILFMLVKSILPIAVLVTGSLAEVFGLSIIYLINPILGFILVTYLVVGSKISEFDQSLIKKSHFPTSKAPQSI